MSKACLVPYHPPVSLSGCCLNSIKHSVIVSNLSRTYFLTYTNSTTIKFPVKVGVRGHFGILVSMGASLCAPAGLDYI